MMGDAVLDEIGFANLLWVLLLGVHSLFRAMWIEWREGEEAISSVTDI